MSVRNRLIVYLTLLVATFWIAASSVSRSVVVHEIDEMIAHSLTAAANRMMPLVLHDLKGHEDRDDDNESTELDDDFRFRPSDSEGVLAFQVRDRSGVVRLQSFDAKNYDFPKSTRPGLRQDDELLTYTLTDRETGISLVLGEPLDHRQEAISEATVALFTPLLLMVPLIVLAIFYLARYAVEPIRELRLQISNRGGSNFDKIDVSGQPEELRPIADAVDRLLERLRAAMDAERAFAANSAHELRTPIAGALAQTQRLKEELADGPGKQRALEIEATLKRLAEFTDKLLQLSRVDAEPSMHSTRENMAPVLDLVVRDFTEQAENPARITVENRLNQDLIVAMDPDALSICLRNLLENAIRHGDGKTPVELIVDKDWSIHVINAGPVVPQDRLNELTKRFARGDTRAAGSGLGLSIVDRIMTQSGGSLSLHSPALGREDGFEAILHLP